MDRGTFYDWKVKDPEFLSALESIEPDEDFADFVEDALVEILESGGFSCFLSSSPAT